MNKSMKLAIILVAAVGLTVIENRAQAQAVSVNFYAGYHHRCYYPPVRYYNAPVVVYRPGYYGGWRRPAPYYRDYDRGYRHDYGYHRGYGGRRW
jgi:hypothetical protein